MSLNGTILVIDDDQSVGEMISRTLRVRGYEVFAETQARSGVEKAGEVLPDVVFISLLLDATNGLKVSKEIHSIEKLSKVPVVMLISYKGELDPRYTLTIGIVDVLVKPLEEKEIISMTEAILGPDTFQPAAEPIIPEPADFLCGEEKYRIEEREIQRTDAHDLIAEAGTRVSGKKVLIFAAALTLIVVIGIGTFWGLRFFFSGKDMASSQEQGISRKDMNSRRQKTTEAPPATDTLQTGDVYTDRAASAAVERDIKKGESVHSISPVKGIERPSALQSKRAIKLPAGEPAKGTFSVQVGYFGDRKNAEVLAEKMKLKGYRVFLKREEKTSGEIFYRVLVGKFSRRAEALEHAEVILRKDDMKSLLYKE